MNVKKVKQKAFKLNRNLHRDIGYLCIGFTLIFGISGIALNHIEDWNPNYVVERSIIEIPALATSIEEEGFDDNFLSDNKITIKKRASVWSSPNEYKLFLKDNSTVTFNIKGNQAIYETIKPRLFLKRFNDLHLNNVKKWWTYVSDVYAVCLIYLALSALFMIKGKYGIKGRGGFLTALGFIIPIALILYFT